jgi:hypothetical protein
MDFCMVKSLLKILAIYLLIALLPLGSVLAYSYSATVAVTNNTATDFGMTAFSSTVNNTYLVAHGYILSSGLDTRVVEGTSEIPHMVTDNKVWFATTLNAGVIKNELYTFGNNVTLSMPIIVGHGGHLTISDSANLEPAALFSFVWSNMWIDTTAGTGKDILDKTDNRTKAGICVYVSPTVSGTITVDILAANLSVAASISVVGIASGFYDLTVLADGNKFYIYIDGVMEAWDFLP